MIGRLPTLVVASKSIELRPGQDQKESSSQEYWILVRSVISMCLNCLVAVRSVASCSMANQNVSQIILFSPFVTIAIFQFGTLSYPGLGFGLYYTQWRIGWSSMSSIGSPTGKQHIFVTMHLVMIIYHHHLHIVDQMSRAVNLTFAEATVAALRAALEENPEVFPIMFDSIPPLLLLHLFLIFFLLLKMFPYAICHMKFNQDVPLIWIHDYHLMEVGC